MEILLLPQTVRLYPLKPKNKFMKVIIDRFEDSIAVCEKPDRTMLNIPREKLPNGAKEGDVLDIEGENISLKSDETAQRKTAIENKMRKLRRKD